MRETWGRKRQTSRAGGCRCHSTTQKGRKLGGDGWGQNPGETTRVHRLGDNWLISLGFGVKTPLVGISILPL